MFFLRYQLENLDEIAFKFSICEIWESSTFFRGVFDGDLDGFMYRSYSGTSLFRSELI